MPIVLHGIKTIIEWQCAHNAVEHAEAGKRNALAYATPEGSLTLLVTIEEGVVHVEKSRQ